MPMQMQELDRDMDTAFDSLYVLNAAVGAIMNALPADSAARVVQSLDGVLAEMPSEPNPPTGLPLLTLRYWRDAAATNAGFPCKYRQT